MSSSEIDINAVNERTAREMQSKGGQSRSEAKQKASRENGKKGGRPKKVINTNE